MKSNKLLPRQTIALRIALGMKLQAARRQRKLTTWNAAAAAGIAYETFRSLQRGQCVPDSVNSQKLLLWLSNSSAYGLTEFALLKALKKEAPLSEARKNSLRANIQSILDAELPSVKEEKPDKDRQCESSFQRNE